MYVHIHIHVHVPCVCYSGDQSSQVHSLLLEILVEVLQETKQALPMEAFDSIMTCILEPQKVMSCVVVLPLLCYMWLYRAMSLSYTISCVS